jgi:hypothetical protein
MMEREKKAKGTWSNENVEIVAVKFTVSWNFSLLVV